MEGSFEEVAAWWEMHAGDDGDVNHRLLILPALLTALGDLAGLEILDLGCGNGTSSRRLARGGARVTGVDLSPSLVALARERDARDHLGITYLVGDAAHLPMFADASFARVAANMMLMDAEDGVGVLRTAARLLPPGGRFVASLLHPCYEVPGHSDWAFEGTPSGDRWVRRVWRYREPFTIPELFSADQPAPIMRYQRPMSWYAARLREVGLLIDTLDEPIGDEAYAREKPRAARGARIVPSFLIVGATKIHRHTQFP